MTDRNIRMSYYEAGSGELVVEYGFRGVAEAREEGARRAFLGKVDMSGFGILIDEEPAHRLAFALIGLKAAR